MAQKLILPLHRARLTASIDTAAYYKCFGRRHAGCDLVSASGSRLVRAGGEGTVAAAGYDEACGNVVVVLYPQARNHRTGKVKDLCLRYFHLASVAVREGQTVSRGTVIGYYGHTGTLGGTGAHLHLEADTDPDRLLDSPTPERGSFLKGTAQGAKAVTDPESTHSNPMGWLHVKVSPPERQGYGTARDGLIRPEDAAMPTVN